MTKRLTVVHADPLCHAAKRLLQLMSIEAKRRYPEEWPPSAPLPRNQPLQSRSAFVIARLGNRVAGCCGVRPLEADVAELRRIARLGNRVAGCCGVRPLEPDVAELRRMYVVKRNRRQGVVRAMLQEVESIAARFGFRAMRFATGTRQPEAMEFYETEGYVRIAPCGEHTCDPLAVCYEKPLVM